MNKSKIEWVKGPNGESGYTWNPVTGCYHGCPYCYAKRIAERFGGQLLKSNSDKIHDLEWQEMQGYPDKKPTLMPYPYGFEPTFHRYRLNEPKQLRKPSKIFVVSMGDLFGEWVPDEWIDEVMKAITKAPQHIYLFLTKNPSRYWDYVFGSMNEIPQQYDFSKVKMMFGTTVTSQKNIEELLHYNGDMIDFLSVEPLLEKVDLHEILEMQPCCMEEKSIKWVIVGAQTGPGAKPPEPEWVQKIIDQCRESKIPVFLKNNLNWPEKIQEFPREMIENE